MYPNSPGYGGRHPAHFAITLAEPGPVTLAELSPITYPGLQHADATGDPRFHHASFQDSVAPLNYGIAGVLYAAAARAPQLADGAIEFDEYFDHVSS